MVLPRRGISVYTRPDGLDRFGGAHEVGVIPEGVRIVQVGKDPFHHEIIPAEPMPFDAYVELLNQIPLVPV
jgi:hypothetical protein